MEPSQRGATCGVAGFLLTIALSEAIRLGVWLEAALALAFWFTLGAVMVLVLAAGSWLLWWSFERPSAVRGERDLPAVAGRIEPRSHEGVRHAA